jgi:hypothetical protein
VLQDVASTRAAANALLLPLAAERAREAKKLEFRSEFAASHKIGATSSLVHHAQLHHALAIL